MPTQRRSPPQVATIRGQTWYLINGSLADLSAANRASLASFACCIVPSASYKLSMLPLPLLLLLLPPPLLMLQLPLAEIALIAASNPLLQALY